MISQDILDKIKSPSFDLNEVLKNYTLATDKMTIISKPEVQILADSISPEGKRLTTFQLKFWRAILPEVTRHRVFSFCVRSSRANPTINLINQVRNTPYGPSHWGMNQKGMVADNELTGKALEVAQYTWKTAAKIMADCAESLKDSEVHKQVVNRLLEPFTYSDMVLAGTEFDNFFDLREAPDAQPEIRELALAMHKALDASTPVELKEGEWHLPYISAEDKDKANTDVLCKVSCARCARVSYKAFDGTSSIDKDLALFNRLKDSKHWSPMEFVATPSCSHNYKESNYIGWNQYRRFYN